MFQAQTENQYIPSKSVAVKPEVTSSVGAGEEIRINIPSFVGFVDPSLTYFKAEVQFKNARGQLVPDPKAGGVHALFRQVTLRDGGNQTTLELCEDYNAFKSLTQNFISSPSVAHKNELFEGVQDVVGNKHTDKTLYYAQHEVAPSTATAPDTSSRVAHKVMVQAPLNCGLFKQGNILPVSAMNGMRVTIQTDDLLRSCVQLSKLGEKGDMAVTKIKLTTTDKAQGSELRTTGEGPIAGNGSATTGYIALTDMDHDNNPFAVGDVIYIADDDGNFTNEEALGNVLGFFRSGDKLGINYLPSTLR